MERLHLDAVTVIYIQRGARRKRLLGETYVTT